MGGRDLAIEASGVLVYEYNDSSGQETKAFDDENESEATTCFDFEFVASSLPTRNDGAEPSTFASDTRDRDIALLAVALPQRTRRCFHGQGVPRTFGTRTHLAPACVGLCSPNPQTQSPRLARVHSDPALGVCINSAGCVLRCNRGGCDPTALVRGRTNSARFVPQLARAERMRLLESKIPPSADPICGETTRRAPSTWPQVALAMGPADTPRRPSLRPCTCRTVARRVLANG